MIKIASEFPKIEKKLSAVQIEEGRQSLGLQAFESADLNESTFSQCFENAPPLDEYGGESSRDRYLSSVGLAFAKALEEKYGWKLMWATFPEDNYRINDGAYAVVSPDEAYLIFPIHVARRDFQTRSGICANLATKIEQGELPPSEPGQLVELY